ncbi:MAG TPA: glycosyltransferase, partial [Pyrinomonadaceae bacterium]
RAAPPAERAAERRRTPFVFVFDERTPTPDRDAGSARMFHILRSLARWSRPVFIPFNRPTGTNYESLLWREGIETASLVDYARLLRERRPYAAIFSRPEVADALLEDVRRASPGIKIVYDMVDAYFIRIGREAELSGDARARAEAARYREIETRLAQASDLFWCASPEDRRALEREVSGRPVEIIPTIHTPHGRGLPFDERRDLLFVGNLYHRPNSDGVQHFMREIFPLVREALPGVRLTIVGDNSSPEISAYASDAVRVTGYVPDVDPFFERSRVFVAPIRFGAGVKGKIGESLAYGLPVVTTPVGAEGMGLEDGTSAMITPDARAFADAVVRLYLDGELWQKLSDNGYAHVREHFSPEVVERRINEPLMRLGRAGSLPGQNTQQEQAAKPIL